MTTLLFQLNTWSCWSWCGWQTSLEWTLSWSQQQDGWVSVFVPFPITTLYVKYTSLSGVGTGHVGTKRRETMVCVCGAFVPSTWTFMCPVGQRSHEGAPAATSLCTQDANQQPSAGVATSSWECYRVWCVVILFRGGRTLQESMRHHYHTRLLAVELTVIQNAKVTVLLVAHSAAILSRTGKKIRITRWWGTFWLHRGWGISMVLDVETTFRMILFHYTNLS